MDADARKTPPDDGPAPGLDAFDQYLRTVEAHPDLEPDEREILAAAATVNNAVKAAATIVWSRFGLSCRAGEVARGDPTREAGRAAVLQLAGKILDVWAIRVAAAPALPLAEAEPEAPETLERVPIAPIGFPPEDES